MWAYRNAPTTKKDVREAEVDCRKLVLSAIKELVKDTLIIILGRLHNLYKCYKYKDIRSGALYMKKLDGQHQTSNLMARPHTPRVNYQ